MSHDTAPRTLLVGGRAVGYRRFGHGPAVALLHASPRSAAALVPLGLRLAERFTVFAFDTPGFGWSDPLRLDRPDADDYAAALIATFDALGLGRVPVYGSHTGAAIAVAAAVRYPHRVACLALDGYAAFEPDEQAELLASYLVPIVTHWDGTHLAWIWGRVKDQFTAFPWNRRAQAARLARPLVPVETLHAVACDFLAAGDTYRHAYAAAFRYDHVAGLRAVTVPTATMVRADDLLSPHLERLTDMPSCVTLRRLCTDDAEWAAAMAAALAVGADGAPPPPDSAPSPAGLYAVRRVEGGTIGLLRSGGAGRPIALLPPLPGSARGQAGLARALAAHRPVIALDLPGFGASTLAGTLSGAPDAARIGHALRAALEAEGVEDFDTVALGESASIGAALAQHGPLVLVDPVPEPLRAATLAASVDVAPRIDGTHLLAAWHQLRDTQLWRPWFQRDPAHAIDAGPDPDVPALHAVLADWMRGGPAARATLAAALAAPTAAPGAVTLSPGTERRSRADAILAALSSPQARSPASWTLASSSPSAATAG